MKKLLSLIVLASVVMSSIANNVTYATRIARKYNKTGIVGSTDTNCERHAKAIKHAFDMIPDFEAPCTAAEFDHMIERARGFGYKVHVGKTAEECKVLNDRAIVKAYAKMLANGVFND